MMLKGNENKEEDVCLYPLWSFVRLLTLSHGCENMLKFGEKKQKQKETDPTTGLIIQNTQPGTCK